MFLDYFQGVIYFPRPQRNLLNKKKMDAESPQQKHVSSDLSWLLRGMVVTFPLPLSNLFKVQVNQYWDLEPNLLSSPANSSVVLRVLSLPMVSVYSSNGPWCGRGTLQSLQYLLRHKKITVSCLIPAQCPQTDPREIRRNLSSHLFRLLPSLLFSDTRIHGRYERAPSSGCP